MSALTYPECIKELYESEVLGEAVFVALYNVATSDEHKYKFGTMAQLESETKARLRPFLAKHNFQFIENVDENLVAQISQSYRNSSWKKFIEEQRDIVAAFVRRFEEIEQLAPAEDKSVVRSMVLHERAILRFIELEANDTSAGSINDVVAQLHFPLPNPSGY